MRRLVLSSCCAIAEIKLGYMHVCFEYQHNSPYAYVSRRMQWKFWRWEIIAIYSGRNDDPVVGTNLTKLGAIGTLKLLGVTK